MQVVRAECAGACYGVQRALDMAYEAADEGLDAQTMGPLIHNPLVVQRLEDQGIGVAETLSDISGDTIIVRSHGVTPEVIRDLEDRNLQIIDATCPHVLRAQRAASSMAEDGRDVVVVGEADHPEVKGLCAWAQDAGASVFVALTPSDLPETLDDNLGVVVQTTMRADVLQAILDELETRDLHPRVANTICNATSQRQDAARNLAQNVDAMVVIGGKNSSNTQRLYEICADVAPKAFHVETPDDLVKQDFSGCSVVGITAGASTPEEQIRAVEDCLRGW